MKNLKSMKIIFLTLFVVLILGMTFSMGISAEEDTEFKPQIISQNIEYSKCFKLMYAVDAASVTGPVELRVYETYPTDKTEDNFKKRYTVSEITPASQMGNLGMDAYVFTTDGISYTDMALEFYIQAIDIATGKKSEVKRYSVAEYFYERLSNPNASAEQKSLYKSTIQFGAAMQLALDPNIDESKLISNLRYILVDGGTVEGYKAGLFAVGDTVSPTVQGGKTWNVVCEGEGGVKLETYENVSSIVVPDTEGVVKLSFSLSEPLG